MRKRLIYVSLALILIFGTLFGWKPFSLWRSSSQMMGPPPAVVAVTQVREESWRPELGAVGSLVAAEGIALSNEVAGVVSAIHFESGQEIKRGQPLITLDATADRAELKGLQAAKRLAELKYERAARLLPERSMSQADYDEARAVLDGAEAAVAAKQALIGKKLISAPFDGVLGIRQVDLGQYLPAGTAIVPLQSLSPIYADFSLPERHLALLRTGQSVKVGVQAYPDEGFEGAVTALNPGIDRGTRSIRLRATLANRDRRLRPGMFAEVRLLLPEQKPVLTLPDTAITFNPYGDSVFLILEGKEGLRVQRKQVKSGEVRQGRVAILEGLAAGEQVVSAGQVKLRNGMRVVTGDKPAPGERQSSP
ncbi:MAG: efflux RND transporter periplasmic adaptor subunit [Gammaproteobacteria bacterium]|nr:efflux RND transporter periplasmic adaptor subunit [Gammaproteobacteria bacterium]MBU1656440.1 efflux RND transporter periplasmic adaptor subunit [Gammaproteobacteria bacterium]MBU1960425.1 efflux RND transporter periplasmic adaptor subunit [Gammaproteobacteria bacterium]